MITKNIFKIFFLLVVLVGCQKDDKVYRNLIHDDWGKQLYDKVNGDVGFIKLRFKDNGYYQFFVRRGDTIDHCNQVTMQYLERDSLSYYIEDGNLFKQDPFATEEEIIEYRIVTLNENNLNIVVADRKDNQSISDRLKEQEVYEKCDK